MNKDRLKAWSQGAGHLCWEDLLLYLDGELSESECRRVAEHLHSCWQCRAEAGKITGAITRFVGCRNEAAGLTPPPGNWARFDSLLRAAAAESSGADGFWSRVFGVPRAFRFAAATAAVAALFIWLRISAPLPVSATEALSRAETAETVLPGRGIEPVVYRKLSLTRRAGESTLTAQMDTWTDLRAGREHRSCGSEVWRDLERVLAKNDLAAAHLLSASGYHHWRGHLRAKHDEVTPGRLADGSEILSIRTVSLASAPVDSILEAGLVVRTRDWRPVSQSMRVRRPGRIHEFEISELSNAVTDRGSLHASVFGATLRPAIPPAPAVHLRPVPIRPVPEHMPAPAFDLDETELLATLALHRAGACLGEPISVVRRDSGIVVRGLVESEERKQALNAFLSSVLNLKVEIETAAEAAAQAAETPAAPFINFQPQEPPALRGGANAVEKQLRSKLSGREMASLANRLVSLSNEWVAHAWALRHLQDAWPESKIARLSVPSRWLLEGMLREHVLALGERVRLYRALLDPHLPLAAAGPAPTVEPASVPDIDQLLQQAQQTQSWTCSLFAGTGIPQKAAVDMVSRLADSLSALEVSLRRVETGVAQLVKADRSSSNVR